MPLRGRSVGRYVKPYTSPSSFVDKGRMRSQSALNEVVPMSPCPATFLLDGYAAYIAMSKELCELSTNPRGAFKGWVHALLSRRAHLAIRDDDESYRWIVSYQAVPATFWDKYRHEGDQILRQLNNFEFAGENPYLDRIAELKIDGDTITIRFL